MPRKSRFPKHEKKPYYAKPGVNSARFRKDPAFKNSRRAMSEFGLASRAATLIRRDLSTLLGNRPQNTTHKQLTKRIAILVRAKKAAGTERIRLNDLDWELLKGFEFNDQVSLSALLYSHYKIAVDPNLAKITITLSAFDVSKNVGTFGGISHMRILAAATAIDFTHETGDRAETFITVASRKQPAKEEITLSLQLTSPVIHPLFVVLGFACFNEVNKEKYELYNLRSRALSLICVMPALPPVYKAKAVPRTKKPAVSKPINKIKSKKPVKKPKPPGRKK